MFINNPARSNDSDTTYTFAIEVEDGDGSPKKSPFNLTCFLATIATSIIVVIMLAVSLIIAYTVYYSGIKPNGTVNIPLSSNITVFYAASLTDVMTTLINPAFTLKYNIGVNYVSDASGNLAKRLKAGQMADVFISADGKISASLLPILLPNSKEYVLPWYTYWASTNLGIAYNTDSLFAPQLESIRNGSKPWYKVLNGATMRIGRTDPDLDPKGYRTVIMTRLAQIFYNTSGIEQKIITSSVQQIYPERKLETYLDDASIDVGFFYDCEKTWGGKLKFIHLDQHLDMSNSSLNSYYEKASYTNTATQLKTVGSAVVYTLSIPTTSNNTDGASKYIQFMRAHSGGALDLVLGEGIIKLNKPSEFYPDSTKVPAAILTQSTRR